MRRSRFSPEKSVFAVAVMLVLWGAAMASAELASRNHGAFVRSVPSDQRPNTRTPVVAAPWHGRTTRITTGVPSRNGVLHGGLAATRGGDNLVAGISEISLAFSLGVLWSEYSVATTGCGPMDFSDTLERVCYQGVIATAGAALFNRIVTSSDLETTVEQALEPVFGSLEESTLVQVRAAEWASALAVLGAFLALGCQYARGVDMDGLSGIDVDMCRALRDL